MHRAFQTSLTAEPLESWTSCGVSLSLKPAGVVEGIDSSGVNRGQEDDLTAVSAVTGAGSSSAGAPKPEGGLGCLFKAREMSLSLAPSDPCAVGLERVNSLAAKEGLRIILHGASLGSPVGGPGSPSDPPTDALSPGLRRECGLPGGGPGSGHRMLVRELPWRGQRQRSHRFAERPSRCRPLPLVRRDA